MKRGVKIGAAVAVIAGLGIGGFLVGRAVKRSAVEEAKPDSMPRQGNPNPFPPNPSPVLERIQIKVEGLPTKGPKDAPVTILEISDFDCPFCRKAAQTVEQLMEEYPGKIRLAFQNYPMSYHRSARPAAEAALAAGDQGKFWEMYERLFTLGGTDRQSLISHAKALKLDMETFTRCLDEQCHRAEIDRDILRAKVLNVKGTPTFFVNGIRIVGARPLEAFKQIVEEELGRSPK